MPDTQSLALVAPIIVYSNVEVGKSLILKNSKSKSGVPQWTHLESDKSYTGSAIDLSVRLKCYYFKKYTSRHSLIYNALSFYGYSAFSLTILEYIDITNLSKKDSKKLILEQEQYYIDILQPKYKILKIAGSSLGYKHTKESIAKLVKIILCLVKSFTWSTNKN